MANRIENLIAAYEHCNEIEITLGTLYFEVDPKTGGLDVVDANGEKSRLSKSDTESLAIFLERLYLDEA